MISEEENGADTGGETGGESDQDIGEDSEVDSGYDTSDSDQPETEVTPEDQIMETMRSEVVKEFTEIEAKRFSNLFDKNYTLQTVGRKILLKHIDTTWNPDRVENFIQSFS